MKNGMSKWHSEKKTVLEAAQTMAQKGYTVGTSGNLSMRLHDDGGRDLLAITPNARYYDTLDTECFDRNAWNDVSLDSLGNISQINSSSLYAGAILFNQFNRFDRYGDQAQPVINFMPDTLCLDTIWGVGSRIHCYTNEAGMTVVPGRVNFVPGSTSPFDHRIVAFLFDQNGGQMGHPTCFDCDIPYTYCDGPGLGSGDINSVGVVGEHLMKILEAN